MEKTTKIILIACIVLVAFLGLTVGILGANHVNTPSSDVLVNDSTNITNSSITNNSSNTTNNKVSMTPEQAMARVNSELSGYYKATSAVLENASPNPVYKVYLIHIDPNKSNYGKYGGYVTVDTVTGFVNHKGV